jgi:hypothetical protein
MPFLTSCKVSGLIRYRIAFSTTLFTATARLLSVTLLLSFSAPTATFRQAMLQAAYYGAILVNARSRALAQARQEGTAAAAAIDKAAEDVAVFTCISNGLSVEVYTHYCEDEQ